jgi:hypothetical protein
VDTDGFGPYQGIRIDASGVAFEVFVTEILSRRDYVLPNYAADYSFWQFMRTHYEAHLVVAEVKNLSRGPGKNEILQVANYLNPRGTGLSP